MPASLFKLDSLLPALNTNTLILTPNNRLKRKILQAWGEYNLNRNLARWMSPRVHSLGDWQSECWQQLQDMAYPGCDAAIASDALRKYAWQQAIQASSQDGGLYKTEVLAATADAAWRNLSLWRISDNDLEAFNDPDFQHYLEWLNSTRTILNTRQLTTSEEACERIIMAFADGSLAKETSILLHGFDDLPPLNKALCHSAAHSTQENVETQTEGRLTRTTAQTSEQEILAAARWAQNILEENKEAKLGIIVPNLGQCRDEVERIFVEVFECHSILPSEPRYALPFNFSAGTPLGSTPLVADTLKLLALNLRQWPLADLCETLQSPFWKAGDEHFRTRLISALKRLGQLTISGADLREQAARLAEQLPERTDSSPEVEPIDKRLQQIAEQLRHHARYQSADRWVDYFQQHLALCHWPGSRRLDSLEYQQAKQWFQLLEEFSELSVLGATLTLNDALKHLSQLANSLHFQAQTPDSPIQILGVLEGAGLSFSHCWVMGLHRKAWPPAPAPNALLPIALQREYQMPHASVERELQFAESLTQGYRQCAEHIVFSSASHDDESAQQPSALISDIPECPVNTLIPNLHSALDLHLQQFDQSPNLDVIDTLLAPALSPDERQNLKGGSGVLQQQASCPFNAFAVYRLLARDAEEPSPGLSALERGIILHGALQYFWDEVKNSSRLTSMSDENITEKLSHCIQRSLQPWRKRRAKQCGPRYFDLEAHRLLKLLQRWLDTEKQRPPFTVSATEESVELTLSGLTLNLRLDRLDTLEDGQVLLIDYKTGEPKISSWDSERPREPQLPLYAISLKDRCSGIAFGQVNAKACQLLGVGEPTQPIEGIRTPDELRYSDLPAQWNDAIPQWEGVLTKLATEFSEGKCAVVFKDKSSGQYSEDLLPLNRYPELGALERFTNSQPASFSQTPVQGDLLND